MDSQQRYTEASIKTADNLTSIAQSETIRTLSQLTLPEIEAIVAEVARLVPAGNIPGLILSGLARLPGRIPSSEMVKRDINLLFEGVEKTLDAAVYGTIFAGPAAVIWAYQNLLKLSGKNPEDAFPEGRWQFYVEYALREDTARHTNETHGFDTFLKLHQLRLSAVDRITAWVMAAINCLHQYDALLTNEWRERVYTHLLAQITGDESNATHYDQLYRNWEKQRPYECSLDCTDNETYPVYRQHKFDQFLQEAMATLPVDQHNRWAELVQKAEVEDLSAYLRQMSILAYLDPGRYGETHIPIPLTQACIGLIDRGSYHLIPACAPGSDEPAQAQTVRAQVAAVLANPAKPSPHLASLARVKRSAWPDLCRKLSQTFGHQLDKLRLAPILLNCDARSRDLPLAELRQTERGAGDHALTLFDTGETIVFDQSHIFFDGVWGAALAEIMTQEALAWARRLNEDTAQPGRSLPAPLRIEFLPPDLEIIQQAPQVAAEVGAETDVVNLKNILRLRKEFRQRSLRIQLTVNDLLILYRAIHALTYQANSALVAELKNLAREHKTKQAALTALAALDSSKQVNPAIAIPVDASLRSPRARLYPMTFEVPPDLDFVDLHRQALIAVANYERAAGDQPQAYAEFDRRRRDYLATLAGFGELLNKGKEIARKGESISIGALRLLAYMPLPLQRLLDKIPERIDILNDLIKGREVISNVGAVAPTSSLTRFIAAKDDNDKKTLVWGVITDAQGVMRITLRDFRPHVGLLMGVGHQDLAKRLAQHYLDTYAHGLNDFIGDLRRITQTSHRRLTRKSEVEQ